MVERSSVRSIVPSPGILRPARLMPMFWVCCGNTSVQIRRTLSLKGGKTVFHLLRMPVDDRAEQLPFLAGEPHHLHLLDRIEIGRRGLDANAGDVGVDLEIHVRD